jgi:hypothetical protein
VPVGLAAAAASTVADITVTAARAAKQLRRDFIGFSGSS